MSDIAVFCSSYFPNPVGGGERTAKWIVDYLKKTFNPTIYSFGDVYKRYEWDGVPIVQLKTPSLARTSARPYALSQRLVKEGQKHDLIYCHGLSGPHAISAAVASLTSKTKLVYHTHSSFMGRESAKHRYLLRPLIRAETAIADSVIFVSNLEKKELVTRGYISDSGEIVIENGVTHVDVDSEKFEALLDDRVNHSVSEYILSVGDVTPEKGQEKTVNALKEIPQVDYILIGEVKRDPIHVAEQHGVEDRVHVLGPLSYELTRSAMAGASCLMHISDWESYGLVVAEALAEGTPCVVTDNCGVASLIENGENGYIVGHDSDISEIVKKCANVNPSPKFRSWKDVASEVSHELNQQL
ncbi:glycosyltransferase family 4 protein [Haloprofundus sp. MHR1]|uniref:glycosyltransferase family 4 protein n=1 Tax=Haloprofundus sp. MHR1 TaxID=2572921 RepID=UPI0010BF1415|nr:glycosyltransferase family 4 protein [Haloprofundus sp. MHR1]QCJ45907.1 glycosyltransferase family 4 protein [Haloprofundus sp. MHR1]